MVLGPKPIAVFLALIEPVRNLFPNYGTSIIILG